MRSARAIYHEIRDNDDTYQLFCSIAAKGEAQGGAWTWRCMTTIEPPTRPGALTPRAPGARRTATAT